MPINYDDYPKNWRTEIRPRILARDKHCCAHCGVKNYTVGQRRGSEGKIKVFHVAKDHAGARSWKKQKIKAKKIPTSSIIIVLTVAHLDHDEWNHQVKDERLAALCQRCHLRYDKHDNKRRKKWGKHYARYQKRIF
jgi:5-methylcytosine-specific restriction endonuclease McrA